MTIRIQIANELGISEVYVRSMCNGNKPIPGFYALAIERLTGGAVPRYITSPQLYPPAQFIRSYLNNDSPPLR